MLYCQGGNAPHALGAFAQRWHQHDAQSKCRAVQGSGNGTHMVYRRGRMTVPTMPVPLMLPELCIVLTVPWPVCSHRRGQVSNQCWIKGTVTFWRMAFGGAVTILWPGSRLARAVAPLIVWPQAM